MIIDSGSELFSEAYRFLRTGIWVKKTQGLASVSYPAYWVQWRGRGEETELVIGFDDHSELVVQISDVRATEAGVQSAVDANDSSSRELLRRRLLQLIQTTDQILKVLRRMTSEG